MNQHDIDPAFPAAHYMDGRDLNCHVAKAYPKEAPQVESEPEPSDPFAITLIAVAIGLALAFVLCATDAAWPLLAALSI